MSSANSIVFVVDDDPSVRDALSNSARLGGTGCANIRIERGVPQLQQAGSAQLPGSGCEASGNERTRISGRTVDNGNPDSDHLYYSARRCADDAQGHESRCHRIPDQAIPKRRIARGRSGTDWNRITSRREEQAVVSELMSRYEKLTSREREVLELVTTGLMNKEIAAKLGLSEITVKIHRRQVMTKMEATSLADLVRMADKIKSRSKP